jgi:hypothetical protein
MPDLLSVKLQRLAAMSDFRSNLVRMVAVGGFYAIHLVTYSANSESTSIPVLSSLATLLQLKTETPISSRVHLAFSLIAVMWIGWALTMHRSLFERRLPGWLPYATACVDTALLTAVLVLSAGAQNPLVCGYLLIVMLVAMRMNLKLVWWTTACGLLGLLTILAAAKWPKGLLVDYPLPVIPRHYQLMLGLAIILAGLIAGQWVRSTTAVWNAGMVDGSKENKGG